MAEVVPFVCWRPRQDIADEVAAAPYDTFTRSEAAEEIAAHPLSFLRIDKSIALFDENIDEYDPRVYTRAAEEMDSWYEKGIIIPDNPSAAPVFLLYRLTKGSHSQTGLMACVSVDDYNSGVIKRHENTRLKKERDRIAHIEALAAHTGPVLLTYPSIQDLDALLNEHAEQTEKLYDFVAPDEVHHELWRIDDAGMIERISAFFSQIPALYIADGHHRAAAAVEAAKLHEGAEGVEANYFLAALFGSDELTVLDYNRVISDIGDYSSEELLAALSEVVDIEKQDTDPYTPQMRGELGMYLDGYWYKLSIREEDRPDDVVESLDVALLHSMILDPLLQITDPRQDPRISYVGGVRGLKVLAERAKKTDGIAFALYPCSLEELFAVADEDRLMPPKSTWFEPKPRSGLAIHRM